MAREPGDRRYDGIGGGTQRSAVAPKLEPQRGLAYNLHLSGLRHPINPESPVKEWIYCDDPEYGPGKAVYLTLLPHAVDGRSQDAGFLEHQYGARETPSIGRIFVDRYLSPRARQETPLYLENQKAAEEAAQKIQSALEGTGWIMQPAKEIKNAYVIKHTNGNITPTMYQELEHFVSETLGRDVPRQVPAGLGMSR